MNQNHPFFSTNTNLYNESIKSSTPTTLNGQNVIISQEQQRRTCDVLNTSISGTPFQMNPMFQPQILQAYKQHFPGGVYFSFLPSAPQEICKCSPNINNNNMASTAKSFFPSSLDQIGSMSHSPKRYFNISERPYQFKLHYNAATSCSDLLNHFTQIQASMGNPDLSGICGYLQQMQSPQESTISSYAGAFFPPPLSEYSSNAKKLLPRKDITPVTAHVMDVLDDINDSCNKKKVSFSDQPPDTPVKHDQSIQISTDSKKCERGRDKSKTKHSEYEENGKRKKSKKNKKRDKTDGYSDSDAAKPEKKPWYKRGKRETSKTSVSSESDSESEQNVSSASYSSDSEAKI